MIGGAVVPKAAVQLPAAMCNRHGLIAGATGTGKTKTLQLMAEQLSAMGVAVFAADVKGDLSGLLKPGVADDAVTTRATELGSTGRRPGTPSPSCRSAGTAPACRSAPRSRRSVRSSWPR